jgi:hypothetical protein
MRKLGMIDLVLMRYIFSYPSITAMELSLMLVHAKYDLPMWHSDEIVVQLDRANHDMKLVKRNVNVFSGPFMSYPIITWMK